MLPLPPLIEAEMLAAQLGAPGLLVLDIRFGPGADEAFRAGHVPRAVHSDYRKDGWRRADGAVPGLAPTEAHLSELFGRLGITPATQVAVVSAGGSASDLAAAARVYWTLKLAGHQLVSVVNGGYAAWAADQSRPVSTEDSAPSAQPPYPVRIDRALLAELPDVETALRTHAANFIDARSTAQFQGLETSPDAKRGGRIPGAISSNYEQAFDPATGKIRPAEALARLHAATPEGPLVSYCNTGHTAALNWFVLSEVLGRRGVRLFPGSMSEWTQDEARPVATGG